MNISNKTQPIKTHTLKEVATFRGPEQLQSAIAAFANSCPRAVVDEHGRELYKYPTPNAFLQHLYVDPQAVKALRVTDVDIMRGHGFLWTGDLPTWLADLHHLTAMALFGRSGSGVSKEERAEAKKHNYRYLYSGTQEEAQVIDLMAELTGLPKERLRIVDKVHDDYIVAVLPEGRKGTIKFGKPEDLATRVKEFGKFVGKAAESKAAHQHPHALDIETFANGTVHVTDPMTETAFAQVSRRVLQKLDKIKRAATNTINDINEIEDYLKSKLEEYRNAR